MAGLGAWLTGLSDEADVATEAGEDYGKKNKMATGDTAADAVRHMTMAALAVKEHPKWGDTIMQAHETLGGGDQRAKRMDEYNNELGIKAFLEIPEEYRKDMSNEEVAAYMTEIVDKEYQYRLKNDGKPSGEGPKFYEKPLVTDGGYDKGGLVEDPWDEDPMMPSEEGLESGDDITAEDFAYFAASMAPVSGEVISAKEGLEAYEEGDYLGAALGAAGAIPGVGMVGRAAKKGADVVSDAVEGAAKYADDIFGNAKVSSRTDDVIEGADPYEAAGTTIDEVTEWKKANSVDNRFKQKPELAEAASKLSEGEITGDEFRALAAEISKPTIFTEVPKVPSLKGLVNGLDAKKVQKGVIGLNKKLEDGERVATRLDIPAYNQFDTWVVSIHGGGKSGNSVGYAQTAKLTDVNFVTKPGQALKIAEEKITKTPFARMDGSWVNHDSAELVADAQKLIDDPEWVQVGMNPYRASYFYDKKTMEPLESAEELIQIGPLVLAKGVKRTTPDNPAFRVDPKNEASPTFNEGGLMAEDETGMPIVGYDEESGNPIPPGSDAENVRDDIPAMLSEGEFVVPADVVKWHGLKHMMEMRDEAKCGLAAMHMEDQIKTPTEEVEMVEEEEPDHHEAMESMEEEMAEEVTMDDHGNGEYPTELGQMSNLEYGDETLLVLMAAEGGLVDTEVDAASDLNEGETEEAKPPVQRLVRRLVRDPNTGKLVVMFVDITTGLPVARKDVAEGMANGTMATVDQSPEQTFARLSNTKAEDAEGTEEDEEETTAEKVISSGGESGAPAPEPVDRTMENNYGFVNPSDRAIATGMASLVPGGSVLANWGINANNTEAVNAARADLGLDPLDTTLGVNMDAAMGMVTDQTDASDDVNVGPFSADVMLTDQIGRTARVTDPDNMSAFDKLKDSKAARFFTGKNVTLDDTPDVYNTSSYLTPFEIQEKQAAGLSQRADGTWGYSAAAEQIGRETLSDMSQETFGSDLAISTADKYGLSLASDRGRQEALGITAQDAEMFDDNDDGKLDAQEQRNMEDFYAGTDDSGSRGLGYDSSYGSQAEADAVADTEFGSDEHFDAIDAQFDSLSSSNTTRTGGGESGSSIGVSSSSYDTATSDGTNSASTVSGGSGRTDGGYGWNKGGMIPDTKRRSYKPKQKYATIKK